MTKATHCARQKALIVIICLTCCMAGATTRARRAETNRLAEVDTTLPEMMVTATRLPVASASIPGVIYQLAAREQREQLGIRTTPELVASLPSVMVQKTSYGQGSPYLRGFTGFRTLTLIDGIRLNNSVFRDGPNQYGNTVDLLSIQRAEVVMGPASVLYGSDAIGGTINLLPVEPPPYEDKPTWLHQWQYRGSSAEDSHIGRIQLGGSPTEQFGFVLGTTVKQFGDLRGGAEVERQAKTGYDEYDFDLRAVYHPDQGSRVVLGHQSVRLDDAWRTHRTPYGIEWEGTTRGSDKVHSFDHERDLTYLSLQRHDSGGAIDGMQATLSRHVQREDRYRVRSNDTADRQGFDVTTWGATLQLDSDTRYGHWVSGFEIYRDIVDSYARAYTEDGSLVSRSIQGPVADDASYTTLGLYAQHTVSPAGGALDVVPGIRYHYARAHARKVEDPMTSEQISIKEDWHAVVGSLRALYPFTPDRRVVAFAGVSQGFRAPNLSDLTRFGISRSGEIETPAPDIDPERYLCYEIGVRMRLRQLRTELSVYRMDLDGMIIRTPTGRMVEGYPEVTKKNTGGGYLQGIEFGAAYDISSNVRARFSGSVMEGKADTYPTSDAVRQRDHISRMMPPTAHAGLRWTSDNGRWWMEAAADMAARADKLSGDDRRDDQRIPPGGTPGYLVAHLRTGWQVKDSLLLNLGLENMFNEDYRIHGSGVNEAGRGLILSATGSF